MNDQPDHTKNTSENDAGSVSTDLQSETIKAPTNPRWLFKLTIWCVVLLGLGVWGYIDATSIYPKRGRDFASWAKWQYLVAGQNANNEDFGVFEREASVADPVAELARLNDADTRERNEQDAANSGSSRHLRALMQQSRLDWLSGLKMVGELDPANTTFETPREELKSSEEMWASRPAPKPLAVYDLPLQWGIMFVGFLGGAFMLIHIFRVKSKTITFETGTKTLTLPGKIAIIPDELELVDKRKWDKFIVFLKLNDSHQSHSGQEVRVDTYQHLLVEDWILQMEEHAFGPQEEDDAGSDQSESDDS